ncbi:MAG: AEC family transporter, partial [Halobacteriales archaeon]
LGKSEPALSALVLSSVFPNAGNYGIPLSEFAFGPVGRSTAVLFIAGQAIMMYTVGVYVASRGQSSTRDAIGRVFRIPLIYAVVLAFLARVIGVVPPTESTVMRTIELVGEASIPVMLLMLGIQLANTSSGVAVRRVMVANAFKLAVAPVIGLGIVLAIGQLESTVARVFILECGMPAAVTPLILAIEFEDPGGTAAQLSRPEYISTAILTTTLISVPTLTVLITVLQAGIII